MPLITTIQTGVKRAAGAAVMRFAVRAAGKAAMRLALANPAVLFVAAAGVAAVVTRQALKNRPAQPDDDVLARATITVRAPRSEVYDLWRRFDNLPRFMEHLESISIDDDRHARWTVKEGPFTLRWTTEITEDLARERIVWRSLPSSQVVSEGRAEFRDAPGGRGTEVHVELRMGALRSSAMAAPLRALLKRFTSAQLAAELVRMRQLMETGELATGIFHKLTQRPSGRGMEN